MAKQFTVQDFFKRFGTDDACLDHLMTVRYGERVVCPKCSKAGRFVRIKAIPAYACPTPRCGHHIHPMAGTPFERSHTALQKWFYAMYLFTTSRHGVSAKELQRQLGVTYKTAWRMGHEIRKYMAEVDGTPPMGGHVEIDETFIGGKNRGEGRANKLKGKSVVFGIVEREGNLFTAVVANVRRSTLEPVVRKLVTEGSTVSTDEAPAYQDLGNGYEHGVVNHSADEWVKGKHHTNSIESFWGLLKRSIRSTHISVSAKYLPSYLGEFEYRHNMRKHPEKMLGRLLLSF
jgi:hypothetical protein